jgi:DNA-binding MarR family transcriptional regulator
MDSGTPAQHEAVRSLMRARNLLVERAESAFAADDLPRLSWYEVLSALDDAPNGGLRPRDLGFAVALTRSGLTRLLDRIHAAGLVERKECPTDRRGYLIVLTTAGQRTLELMRPVYERALEESFAGVSDEDARALSAALDPVVSSACDTVREDDEPAAAA